MDRSVAVDRLFRATVNSWHGLRVAARSEAAVREELVVLVLAVPLAVLVAEGALKRFVLIAVILLLIVVELLNTAIEKLADEITTAPRPGIQTHKGHGIGRRRHYARDSRVGLARRSRPAPILLVRHSPIAVCRGHRCLGPIVPCTSRFQLRATDSQVSRRSAVLSLAQINERR
jgi:diacylglycerol kinase (ATP)